MFGNVSNLRKWVSVIILLVVTLALYWVQTNKVITFQVTSSSMEPTLKIGEKYVMIEPTEYQIGDVVVLQNPGSSDGFIVKRLVAASGDRVALIDGLLYVNGTATPPPGGLDEAPPDVPDQSWIIPDGQIFVVGDNRAESYDSRDFGPVPESTLKGLLRIKY